jgi:hypothetical protein
MIENFSSINVPEEMQKLSSKDYTAPGKKNFVMPPSS